MEGITFIPISVAQEDQVKRIARAQERSSGKEEDMAIKQLFQRSCWSRAMYVFICLTHTCLVYMRLRLIR